MCEDIDVLARAMPAKGSGMSNRVDISSKADCMAAIRGA